MSVALTPELEAMIQERIESGRHSDACAVIGYAAQLLKERVRSEHLNALLAVGLDDVQRGD